MTINATIDTLIQTNQTLVQLANTALPPKAKYWIGRIAEAAHSALMEYEQKRSALVMKMGQPVKFEPQPDIEIDGVMTKQADVEVVVTDPKEIETAPLQWKVKGENVADFNAALEVLQSEEVEIKFDKIKLSALGDMPIALHIAALTWLFDDQA